MKKLLHKKLLQCTLLFALLLTTMTSWGQLATWNPSSLGQTWGPNPWPATTTATNATTTGFVRGTGLGTSGTPVASSYGGSGTNDEATDTFVFTIKANSGYQMSITGISNWFTRRSTAGASSIEVLYSTNGSTFTSIGTVTGISTGGAQSSITFPTAIVNALANIPATTTVTLKFLAIGGTGGNLYFAVGSGVRFQLDGTITADRQSQTITFGALTTKTYGDAPFALTGSSSSGLAVTYTSSNTSVATVSGNTVTILSNGSTTITANQAGNTTYAAANAVSHTLTVNKKSLTVTGLSVNDKIYDASATATLTGNAALEGTVGTDVLTLGGTPIANFNSIAVGTNKPVTVTGYTISGAQAARYTLVQPTLNGAITAKELTVNGIAISNKVFDGTAAATITGTPVLDGVINNDNVLIDSSAATAQFTNNGPATAIPVTVSGYTLTGTATSNYSLLQPQGLSANVTDASLQNQFITFTLPATATYGDTSQVLTGTSSSGLELTYTSTNTDVATITGNTLTIVGIGTATIIAGQAGNDSYNPAENVSQQLTVNKKQLTVNNPAVTSKIYDGNDTATATGTLNGIVGNDVVTLGSEAVFGSKNVGENITAFAIYTLTGADANKYTLAQSEFNLTGTITPKALTVNNAVAQNKVYDGTAAAVVTGTLAGIVTGDTVTLNGTGTFSNANVANGIFVTPTATSGGASANNYILTQPTGLTANITPKQLTVTATAQNKVYDRNTSATVSNGTIASGIIEGDMVSLVSDVVAGTFNSFAVGTNKQVTAQFDLQGEDGANYTTVSQSFTANITPATLTVDITGATVANKIYDNSAAATISGAVLTGIIEGDVVTTSGSFTTLNAGVNIPVNIILSGTNAGSYILQQPATALTGTITKKGLTATANIQNKDQGTTNPTLTIAYSGFISGQSQTNAAGFVAPVATNTAATSSPVGAYPITLSGGQATNYEFTSLTNGTLIINPTATSGSIWTNPLEVNGISGNPYTAGDVKNANITVSGIGTGTGVTGQSTNNRYNASSWNTTAIDSEAYFKFSLTPNTGYKINFTNFVYTGQASGTGPTAFSIKSSADGFVANIATPTEGGMTVSLSAAAYQNITSDIEFRIYGWGTTNAGGTYSINDFTFNGSVVEAPKAPLVNSLLTDTSVINTTDTYQITATGTPVITYTAANLPIGAAINNTGLISFDGTTPAGTYNIGITATSYYGTNTKTLVYTVTKLNQVVTFDPDPIPTKFLGDAPFLFEYSNSAYLPITWSSSNPDVATIAQDGTVTIVGVGTTTLTASNTGNDTYNPVATGRTLTVLMPPVITVTPSPVNILAIEGRGASQPVQLTNITGTNLLPAAGTVTLTVSEPFQIAFGVAAYANTGSLTYTGGSINLNDPQIALRLAAGQLQGSYTGTLTITGGGVTKEIPLNGTVEEAPSITTVNAAYGPYCQGDENTVFVEYSSQGTFDEGSFYVQQSDAAGIFTEGFSNIISSPANSSPIIATLPASLVHGNYRLRAVHLSSSLLFTKSTNDNGNTIKVNELPSLSGVSNPVFCGSNATIRLSGLIANIDFNVTYTINNGTALTATVAADVTGTANFVIPVTQAANGMELAITELKRTDAGCTKNFTANNSVQLFITENTWTGAENSNWNNVNNWSCGLVPSINTPVVIAPSSNIVTMPQGTTYCKTVEVQNGASLIVTTGNTLHVEDKVTVLGNGSFTIENNAALIQGATVTQNTNVGNITAIKNSNTIYHLDYTLWSSPTSGTQTLHDFSSETLPTRYYEYGIAGGQEHYIAIPGATTFTPAKGYLIRMPDNDATPGYFAGTTPMAFTGNFTGTPNNGTVTIPASVDANMFTAVGNPYPSPISVEAFFAANEDVLNGSSGIYFWRKKNSAAASSYATLTLAAYTSNAGFSANPIAGGGAEQAVFFPAGNEASWLISQGQGFFVKTAPNPTGTTITFTNAMRRAAPASGEQAFFRTGATTTSRYWLNLTDGLQGFSQTAVAYMANGTLGLDYGYDGRQFSDGGNATLYSLAESTRLAIQARPEFAPSDVVPMGFKVTNAGQFTISLDHMDGLFEQGQDIYLKDNLLGLYHDLGESNYTFTSEAGTINDRFEVVYTTQALGSKTPQLDPNSIIVYKQGNTININSGTAAMTGVTIYDVRGRILYSNKKINATQTAINSLQVAQEVLIVEISTVRGKVSKRIVF